MRDLKADLEICNLAPKGPYKQGCEEAMPHSYDIQLIGYREVGNHPYVIAEANQWFKEESVNLIRFIVAAREGWPEAIERAIAAEEQVIKSDKLIADWIDVAKVVMLGMACKCELEKEV